MADVHLNRKLVLERAVRIADGAGGFTQSWQQIGTLWAEIRAGSGRETKRDAMAVSRVPVRIFVRGAPLGSPRRPDAEQRFIEGGRVFRILSVTEADSRGQYLECRAVEEVAV